MIVITNNSTYEFDGVDSRYRKIKPQIEEWKIYYGFFLEPCVGKRLVIIRDQDKITTTSVVLEIQDDDDDDLDP